jgi:hypothetical protein
MGIGEVKTCSKCGETKPAGAFYPDRSKPDGRRSYCKDCGKASAASWAKANPHSARASSAAYRGSNPEKVKVGAAAWKKANPEKNKASYTAWDKANPEKRRALHRAWDKANPGKANARTRRRQAAKLQATPAWANNFFMQEAYTLAALRTRMLGFKWHVDHVVPLRSKIVCGLHCEANLRVIPAVINMSKGNRYWPDMP